MGPPPKPPTYHNHPAIVAVPDAVPNNIRDNSTNGPVAQIWKIDVFYQKHKIVLNIGYGCWPRSQQDTSNKLSSGFNDGLGTRKVAVHLPIVQARNHVSKTLAGNGRSNGRAVINVQHFTYMPSVFIYSFELLVVIGL
ncbi:hypothetical protein CTI12_AA362270 [Artemisia annua]|uniref:Uncharacterized protein n=1 Tax=Artemisia annua TaxID=35608 RepID=A0A2U1MMY2_ARTAN|nr:hypothetical protein CTI12_AA362270 [Artemisia annua]